MYLLTVKLNLNHTALLAVNKAAAVSSAHEQAKMPPDLAAVDHVTAVGNPLWKRAPVDKLELCIVTRQAKMRDPREWPQWQPHYRRTIQSVERTPRRSIR